MVPFRVESRSTVGGLEERKRGGGSDCQRADERGGWLWGRRLNSYRSVGLWGRRRRRGGAGKEARRREIEIEKENKRKQWKGGEMAIVKMRRYLVNFIGLWPFLHGRYIKKPCRNGRTFLHGYVIKYPCRKKKGGPTCQWQKGKGNVKN